MSWPAVALLSVLFIWGTRVLVDWLSLREHRRDQEAALKPPAHACVLLDLETIAAKPLTSDNPMACHQTVLLKRCRYCGNHCTFLHNGYWTTEDFLKTQADANWLKEQMG